MSDVTLERHIFLRSQLKLGSDGKTGPICSDSDVKAKVLGRAP